MSILASILALFSPAKGDDVAVCYKPTTVGNKPTSDSIDIPRLIRAIKSVENWDGHSIGAKGERGPLQIKKATWKQFAPNLPHQFAILDSPEIKRVEQDYAEWLVESSCDFIVQSLCHPTNFYIYTCALIHTAGYGNVMKGRIGKAKREFADRVVNCYEEGK